MYRILLFVALAATVGACSQGTGKGRMSAAEANADIVAASIEEVVSTPAEYKDQTVAIQGMVTHVCRHGGQKCFVVGEDGEIQIRLVPAGDIDEFKIELEGSTLAVKGILKVMSVSEAEEHLEDHESKEHHSHEMAHTEAEKADIFIEVTDFREVTR